MVSASPFCMAGPQSALILPIPVSASAGTAAQAAWTQAQAETKSRARARLRLFMDVTGGVVGEGTDILEPLAGVLFLPWARLVAWRQRRRLMLYRVLADAVVLLHFAFVAFVVLGGLLVLRWPWTAWVHLPAAAWGAFVELYLHYCPLTPLENWLRERGGLVTYDTGFIAHYIMPVIYP